MTENSSLEELALSSARRLTLEFRGKVPPFRLKELCQRVGICKIVEVSMLRDARLIRETSGFRVEVQSAAPIVRKRLSIAHEIGHLLLEEFLPLCEQSERLCKVHVEEICTQIAGELLVPDWALKEFLEEFQGMNKWNEAVRCSAIIKAACMFNASVEVLARRVFRDLEMAPGVTATVWRRETGGNSQLRVSTAWHSREENVFIPRGKRAPNGSVIEAALSTRTPIHKAEEIRLGSLKGSFLIEAMAFGPYQGPAVLALLRKRLQ